MGPSVAPSRIALVAAVARNGVIGRGLALPWRLPGDLARFRALTMDHAIVMGRRTWQSLPRALPGRQNIVVSSDARLPAAGAAVVPTFAAALATVTQPPPVYVIGGAVLYAAALPEADALYLTEIDADYDGDVLFPAYDRGAWREVSREAVAAAGDTPAHAYVHYVRRDAAPVSTRSSSTIQGESDVRR
ncbi:MAG: dihydrofolate reductase [Proteobacteria bacterium]|nr:dihydrofolate reductase [Pseudomonadota bacterium]